MVIRFIARPDIRSTIQESLDTESTTMKKIAYFLVTIAILILPPTSFGKAAVLDHAALAAEPGHSETSKKVINYLRLSHYQQLEIDDELSTRMLNHYMENLDRSRSYFTQVDASEFAVYRDRLDDDLKNGNLTAAYHIFNRYLQRTRERLKFMLSTLDQGIDAFDFDKSESLRIDRDKEPWAADKTDLESLWHKQLKNVVLSMRLSEKQDQEISEKLISRYQTQMKRLEQFKAGDVFQIYMNTFTGLYDPHTQYFNLRTSENFAINMKLSLEGIGAVLQSEDEFTKVLRLVPAGPADTQGQLKPTDRILGVGQGAYGDIVDVVGWRLDDVVALVRGPKGSIVQLEIMPADAKADGSPTIISITRDTVRLEEQAAKMDVLEVNGKGQGSSRIGVIDIPTFYSDYRAQQAGDPSYKSTTRDVRRLISELKQQNIDGLVIDLRNNSGGSLSEAITLTGLFIKTGPTVQIRTARGKTRVLEDSDPSQAYSGPLVVLVNRLSASASEIFAGAIQDYQRGIVVGNQTFGKGTVQSLQPVNPGQLKLTQSKFYRISGESTQNRGVIPDIAFPSLLDNSDIGESALPNALPWDTISTVYYRKYGDIKPWIDELQRRHQNRARESADFKYLVETKKLRDALKSKELISLNESVRREEKSHSASDQLKLENKRRAASGKELLKTHSNLKDNPADRYANRIDLEDPLLQETTEILVDYINLALPAVAHN
jgi:carboxyl-terminal processing protease